MITTGRNHKTKENKTNCLCQVAAVKSASDFHLVRRDIGTARKNFLSVQLYCYFQMHLYAQHVYFDNFPLNCVVFMQLYKWSVKKPLQLLNTRGCPDCTHCSAACLATITKKPGRWILLWDHLILYVFSYLIFSPPDLRI